MASPSIPNQPDSVLISRAEFERLKLAQRALGRLRDYLSSPVMKPFCSELAELVDDLGRSFESAEAGGQS